MGRQVTGDRQVTGARGSKKEVDRRGRQAVYLGSGQG